MNALVQRSKLFLSRNGSTILTCLGGVGVVATTVTAVTATPKALQLLNKAEEEKGEKLTVLEVVQTAAPVYIPTVLLGASTLACIFGANILSKRRQASLASAYALIDTSYKEYKKKVIELYGEDADKEVREEIAKDKYDEIEMSLSDGKQLFYDEFSGRYFESTFAEVQRAEYHLNRNLQLSGYACLNEFYDLLRIEEVPGGDEIGWSSFALGDMYCYSWIEFHHSTVLIDDDLECITITIATEPMSDYLDDY